MKRVAGRNQGTSGLFDEWGNLVTAEISELWVEMSERVNYLTSGNNLVTVQRSELWADIWKRVDYQTSRTI